MNVPLPSDESERLAALRMYAVLDTDAERCFDDLTLLAAHICQTPIALLSLIDADRLWLKSRVGFEATEAPRGITFCEHAIRQAELFVVRDASADPRFKNHPSVTSEPHIKFYAGVPLLTAEGHALGTLCVIDRVPRDLTPEQQQALRALGWQIMQQLEVRLKLKELEHTTAERKNAESALHQSEQRCKQIIDQANDIIYQTDLFGCFTFVNPVACRALQYPAEHLIGLQYLDLVRPDQRRSVKAFYEEQFQARTPSTYLEFPAVTRSGETIWLGQNVQLLLHEEMPQGFQAVARDVTKRRKIEEALRESESRYRIVAETASDAIVTIDQAGTILFVNAAAEKIFGYAAAELINSPLARLLPEYKRYVPDPETPGREALDADHVFGQSVETAGIHRSGTETPLEISFGEFKGDGKHLFTGIFRDITERKLAAEAAKKTEEYRNLFRFANDAILILDPVDETVLDVNEKACEIYGRSRKNFVGLNLAALSRGARGEQPDLGELPGQGFYREYETTHFRADGTPLIFHVNSLVIEYQGKRAVLSINRDITERKRIEEAQKESEQRFRGAFGNAAIGMALVSIEGRWMEVNRALCQILGYAEEELLATDFQSLTHPDDLLSDLTHVDQMLSGTVQNYQMEKRYHHRGGQVVWALLSVSLVRDASGTPLYFISQIQDITDRKRAEERLFYDAFHDPLTGLANRALLIDHLQLALERAARRGHTPFAVLFLDLDRFKVVNDSLGHVIGDKLLMAVAGRIKSVVRAGDTVARLGGDEFTVMMEDISDAGVAIRTAERIQQELILPFNVDGQEVFTSASIGVAFSSSADYTKPEDILRDADTAMYRAKALGKNRHEVFNKTMHSRALELLQLETDLRRAYEREEFLLHYQPIVTLQTLQVCGFEALLRWQHPVKGLISPLDFIPLAEETGLIIPIGLWALREACRQMKAWQRGHPSISDWSMSVNLSGRQFVQPDLIKQIYQALQETQLAPQCLKLEITESVVMENSGAAVTMLNELRALGVELSIDDFGTGYSSLSYLHRLPVRRLKIDRSFVGLMNISHENREIVRTIVLLARNLGMDVVAEGVEEEEQALQLRELGSEYGQGFFFSHPLTITAASELISHMVNPHAIPNS